MNGLTAGLDRLAAGLRLATGSAATGKETADGTAGGVRGDRTRRVRWNGDQGGGAGLWSGRGRRIQPDGNARWTSWDETRGCGDGRRLRGDHSRLGGDHSGLPRDHASRVGLGGEGGEWVLLVISLRVDKGHFELECYGMIVIRIHPQDDRRQAIAGSRALDGEASTYLGQSHRGKGDCEDERTHVDRAIREDEKGLLKNNT